MAYSIAPVSSSDSGNSVSTRISVIRLPVSIITSPESDSHLATCSGLPTVADKPIRCTFLPESASNLANPRDNCQPRSLAAKS